MLFSSSQPQPEPPNRASRAQCWTARDGYFGCLARNHSQHPEPQASGPRKYYFVPGEEPATVCAAEREAYHSHCMKSWVDHFNKRIVNEQRSVATQVGLSKSRHPP